MPAEIPQTFLAQICDNPADDTVRLVFADWLEEHGEPERAEFIRVQCELAKTPKPKPPRMLGVMARLAIPVLGPKLATGALEDYKARLERWALLSGRERALLRQIRDANRFGFPDDRPRWSFYLGRHAERMPDINTAQLSRGFADAIACDSRIFFAALGDFLCHPLSAIWFINLAIRIEIDPPGEGYDWQAYEYRGQEEDYHDLIASEPTRAELMGSIAEVLSSRDYSVDGRM